MWKQASMAERPSNLLAVRLVIDPACRQNERAGTNYGLGLTLEIRYSRALGDR